MLKRGEIRALTGIRGIAACFVVIYHFYFGVLNKGSAGVILSHGYMAVDLFFVLSGFVMALTYQDKFLGRYSFGSHISFYTRDCLEYFHFMRLHY